MKYTEIYKRITNPLDIPENIDKLIEAYAEKTSFYSALINRNSKNKDMRYSPSYSDALYASLFNTWKREMLSITPAQYEQAIKNGLYEKDVYKVLQVLRNTPDVATKAEADAIIDEVYDDKELTEAMEKYRWDSIGLYSGWTHIRSRNIRAKKIVAPKIEHRLYINAAQTDLHVLSKLFLDKCTEKNLPYYFKIAEYDRRDDNMVIYTDTKNLHHFLGVLKEIEQEYPDIISRCGKPPVLTGTLRDWIGYGSEPLGKDTSFNGIRSDIIKKSIEAEMKEWYKEHLDVKFNYNGKTMSLYDYISKKVVENDFTISRRLLARNPKTKMSKYTQADMNNPNFAASLEKYIRPYVESIIKGYLTDQEKVKEIPFKVNGNTKKYIHLP